MVPVLHSLLHEMVSNIHDIGSSFCCLDHKGTYLAMVTCSPNLHQGCQYHLHSGQLASAISLTHPARRCSAYQMAVPQVLLYRCAISFSHDFVVCAAPRKAGGHGLLCLFWQANAVLASRASARQLSCILVNRISQLAKHCIHVWLLCIGQLCMPCPCHLC